MNSFKHVVLAEFADRQSDYWEVIPLRNRPETVFKRVRALLAQTDAPGFRPYDVAVSITTDGIFVQFSAHNPVDAENFATILAMNLGWKPEHGVTHGRAHA